MQRTAEMQQAFNQVADSAEPAVVTITTMEGLPTSRRGISSPNGPAFGGDNPFDEFFRRFFGQDLPGPMSPPDSPVAPPGLGGELRRVGLGSGFIIQADGLILTNAHVVRGADTVTVKLSDGKEYKNAKVLGQDNWTDVAVVKIPAGNLPTVPLADSDKVKVGDWAIAIGNPFGLEHTLTVGVISAKAREVPLSDGAPGQYFQTDASINPGNSGGPLLDIYGRVIGINNAIFSQSGGNVGIGFAIPINVARQVADALVKDGRVRRARLGIAIGGLSDDASAFGLAPDTKGVLVESVEPGGPAAKAGLQAGDIITAYNGQAVSDPAALQRAVAATPLDSTVKIDILRNGQTRTVESKVEELKTSGEASVKPSHSGGNGSGEERSLGLQVAPLTPGIASQIGVGTDIRGVVIAAVQPGSAAAQAGLRRGDVIERVGQTPVADPTQLRTAIDAIFGKQASDSRRVALLVNRRGAHAYVIVRL